MCSVDTHSLEQQLLISQFIVANILFLRHHLLGLELDLQDLLVDYSLTSARELLILIYLSCHLDKGLIRNQNLQSLVDMNYHQLHTDLH